MAKNKGSNVKAQDIADYWGAIVDETELSVDASEMHSHCWSCGCERRLEKCHIIPQSKGGEDIPSNLVLLCNECHKNSPDCMNPEIMWDWIKSNKVQFYGVYWWLKATEEYERIYGVPWISQVNIDSMDAFKIAMKSELENTSMHWGNCGLSTGTRVGVLRSFVLSNSNIGNAA